MYTVNTVNTSRTSAEVTSIPCPQCGNHDPAQTKKRGHDERGRRRWKCRLCGRNFTEPASTVQPKSPNPVISSTEDNLLTSDETIATLVDAATRKLSEGSYTKVEYYAELRQITERCGYRLFVDTATLGRNRELFIVSPPGNSDERVVSTQDLNEVLVWLKQQNLTNPIIS